MKVILWTTIVLLVVDALKIAAKRELNICNGEVLILQNRFKGYDSYLTKLIEKQAQANKDLVDYIDKKLEQR